MAHGVHHAPFIALLTADVPLTPELRLWLAVLEVALRDLATPKRHDRAEAWFHSTQDGPGSFRWIAAQFGASAVVGCRHADAGVDLPAQHTWATAVLHIGLGRNKPLASTHRDAIR